MALPTCAGTALRTHPCSPLSKIFSSPHFSLEKKKKDVHCFMQFVSANFFIFYLLLGPTVLFSVHVIKSKLLIVVI